MIIQRTPHGTFAIKQEDHAAMAGFFLEHWSDHNFSHDAEREQIVFATTEHDNGWEEFDAQPGLDPATGLPVPFTAVDAEWAFKIWRKGTKKYLENRPFIALLITHHAYSIYEQSHKRDPAWKEFFTEFAKQRAVLRNQLGMDHPQVERAYSYLRMMDWFSLAYCMNYDLGAVKPEQYAGYLYKRDNENYQFLFRPYPFDLRDIAYELPVYRMADEGYTSEKALRAAFKKPEHQTVTLNPLGRLKR